MLTGQNSHFRVGSRFRITDVTASDFTTRLLNRGQVAGPPLIWPLASLKSFSIQDPEERIVIVLEGDMMAGKTTIATLIGSGCINPHTMSPTSDWMVIDFDPRIPMGVREIAKYPKLIICCHYIDKKYYHWWATVTANAQVFYWRIERPTQTLNLTKPKSITFKNKYL
jgi:hypothetical protein